MIVSEILNSLPQLIPVPKTGWDGVVAAQILVVTLNNTALMLLPNFNHLPDVQIKRDPLTLLGLVAMPAPLPS